jgi:hypothetical protein
MQAAVTREICERAVIEGFFSLTAMPVAALDAR